MPDEPASNVKTPGLSKEQKIGFVLLLVFAVFSVGLGVLQIRNTMYAPFALSNTPPADLKDQVTGVDALRYRDTDRDGLTDFDELYVYGTSQYLYDTFSYGMSDKDLVAKGLPRCPKGQDCGNIIVNDSAVARESVTSTIQALVPMDAPGTPPLDINQILSDPAQLRKLLIEGGMSAADVNKISDQVLLTAVQDIMNTSSPFADVPSLQNLGVQSYFPSGTIPGVTP